MEKEESQNKEDQNLKDENSEINIDKQAPEETEKKVEEEHLSPEDEIANLKDKITRTFAEMENQRRRFEKEKEEAFEYGGFSFAREALNLLDLQFHLQVNVVPLPLFFRSPQESVHLYSALNFHLLNFDLLYFVILLFPLESIW